MAAIDTLLKYLQADNVASSLDEETRDKIADDVITGYEIDEDSRGAWLDTNKEAMEIIKHCESDAEKDFPFPGAAKVIYPLLAPAIIQMAARLSTHIVQNDRVCTYTVLGDDPQGIKAQKADRLTKYSSYSFLIESDTWLTDTHKLCTILSGWGTAFRQVYYDPISKRACHDLIPPEDVIINHNLSCLDKAKRITIRTFLTKNNILEYVNSKKFLDEDIDSLDTETEDLENGGDSREINKAHEFLKQFVYLDLDGDGYSEPYQAFVHCKSQTLFGLYPAFKLKDIELDPKSGKVLRIRPRIDIVDYHAIDDPEGKFYSIGLNYLLVHPNKAITSLERQILDSGTLANTQGGFVTKAFQTQERTLEYKMGQFQVIECDPTVDPTKQIIPLPFKEPSQVLFALLQLLIESSQQAGFITDALTGDIQSQNTPATTMLAMVEQSTRAIKPMIQKLYSSLKKEFKLWFEIQSEYIDSKKYAMFQGQQIQIAQVDFQFDDIDICPVADPNMSSEAHKYAKLKMIVDLLNSNAAQFLNPQAALLTVFEGADFENAQQLIAQPQPPQPDPKIQLEAQKQQDQHQIAQLKLQLQSEKQQNEQLKTEIKQVEVMLKVKESGDKQKLMEAETAQGFADAHVKDRLAKVAEDKVGVEHRKLNIMETQPRNPTGS